MPNYQTLEDIKKGFLRKCAVLVLEFDCSFRKIFNWVLNFIPRIILVEGKLLLGLSDIRMGSLLYVMLDFLFILIQFQ